MPNWCYGNLVFYGRKENIMKFCEDIEYILPYDKHKAIGFNSVNMFPFLEHIGIEPHAYQATAINNAKARYEEAQKENDKLEPIPDFAFSVMARPNFRAYWNEAPYVLFDQYGMMQVGVTVESAWNLDTRLLDLISFKYQILYTYYAEECGMGLYYKGHNGFLPNPVVENTIISGIYNEETDDYQPDIFCHSDQIESYKKDLEGYDYYIEQIDDDGFIQPQVLGMYYDEENKDLEIGMKYDIEIK